MHKEDHDINTSEEEDAQIEVIEQLRSPESQDSNKNIENIEMQEGGHNIKTSEPENAQIEIVERLRRTDLQESDTNNDSGNCIQEGQVVEVIDACNTLSVNLLVQCRC